MKTIEVIDLEKLDSSAITVVDVRSSEDYSKGTFNNAISIPKSDFYNNVSNIEKISQFMFFAILEIIVSKL